MNFLKELISATRPLRYSLDAFTARMFNDVRPLVALKDSCAGRPLLVVGNGPSLNKTPLDEFVNIPAIGMNKIDLLFDRVRWRPSLVVCANGLVAKQHARRFAQSEIPIFLSWKNRWVMPRRTRAVSYFLERKGRDFSTDIVAGVGTCATVTYTALQFAYYMGANPVILFGVDHSFRAEGESMAIVKREGPDVNHFDPNYFRAGTYWGVPSLELSEKGYMEARRVFEENGRKIYDATIGGKLEVFEKISVDQAHQIVGKS